MRSQSFLFVTFIIWIAIPIGSSEVARASSTEIVVRHPRTDPVDFQIFKELNPRTKTLVTEWNLRERSTEKAQECLELLRQRQEAHFQGRNNIKQKFEDAIWDMRFEEDWTPVLRSLMLEMGLERALRQTDERLKRTLATEAFLFADTLETVKALPLWKEPRARAYLLQTWSARKHRNVSLAHLRGLGFQFVKLNGKTHSLETNTEVTVTAGTYRLTALSNHLAPWTTRVEDTNMAASEPDISSLVQGDCTSPVLHPMLKEFRAVHVVFDRLCTRTWKNEEWIPLTETAPQASAPMIPGLPEEPAPTRNTSSFKKYTPALVVAGLIVTALTLHLRSQNAGNAQPSSPPQAAVATSENGNVISIPQRF